MTYQDLIGDVKGYWTPEDGDQVIGTVLQVGWDADDTLAADIQPQGKAPLRILIGDKFWKDWSEADPARGDLVRITYKETPLMRSEVGGTFETEKKSTARYEIEVLGGGTGEEATGEISRES